MTRAVEATAGSDQQEGKISKARLEGLLQVSSSLSQALTPNDVYDIVLGQSVKVLGIRAGGVTVVKEDGSLEIIAAKGQPPGIVEAQQCLPVTANHPVAETVRRGEALYFRSREERDQRFPHMRHLFSPATRSSAFVPLRSQGKAIGALTLSFPEPHAFDEAEREFMAALADSCARALERARSFEREQQSKEHYQTLFNSVDEGFCIFEMLVDDADKFYDYRFLEVNPKFEEHTGLKNAVGKTAKELVPGLEQSWVDIYGKIAATGESVRFEQGSAAMGRWFEVYGTRVGGQDSKKVALIFKDVSEQKRAENKLRESEYRLSIASKAAHIGIHDYNVRTNEIYWDDILRDIWGVTSDEPITYETFAAGLHPDDLSAAEAAVQRAFDPTGSGQYYAEYRVINRQSQETHWVAASGHTFFEAGRAVRLIGTAQDITERKRWEDQLQRANARFRLAEEAAHSFSYEWDLSTGVVERSPNLQQVLGYAPGELANTWEGWAALLHPDDARVQTQAEAKAFLAALPETSYGHEYRVRHKDGHDLWLHERGLIVRDDKGKVQRVIGQTVDVSSRKRLEHNLAFLAELSRDVAPALTPQALMTQVGEKLAHHLGLSRCNFSLVDEAADRITVLYDWRRDETAPSVLGEQKISSFLSEAGRRHYVAGKLVVVNDSGRDPLMAAAPELLEQLQVGSLVDAPYLDNGAWKFLLSACRKEKGVWLEDEVELIREVAARIYLRLERAKAEEALRASEQVLREADKRKDEFLATLAHELRNPLAPIRMGLEIMKRSQDKKAQQEAQAIIERQTNQLVHLVDDLLDISRITRGKINLYKEHVTLAEVMQLALESARPFMAERRHQLELTLPVQEVVLEADKTRLTQVFLNLLTNAAKYSEAGSKITVTTHSEADTVQVSVKDAGIGIAPHMLSHVFDLFARVESGEAAKREGLGIGLSLVKQLVQMHGGTVAAYSPGLGKGSEFTVRLPVVRAAIRAAELPLQQREANHVSRRVLVVDDYEANLKTLARILRLLGHEVMTASEGHTALEVLDGFTPDVILLDINMPGLSGYEVAQLIKAKPLRYKSKLVALTGYGAEEDVRKAKEAGFDHHLVKPVELSVLEKLLNQNF